MQIEKKLILCSILAISIGIAAIVPVAYFMSTVSTAKAETSNDVPWFNVTPTYAFYKANSENSTTYIEGTGTLDTIAYETNSGFGLNYTLNPAAEGNLEGARAEYFQLQIYSDLGPIANETTYFGANSGGDGFDYMTNFWFARENWFNSSEVSGAGGCFLTKFNGTLADSLADGWPGGSGHSSGSSCLANETLPDKFLNAQNAQTIYIDVRRVGSVQFNANSTTVTLSDDSVVIGHMELTKVGDRFIFGEVPANRMQAPAFKP